MCMSQQVLVPSFVTWVRRAEDERVLKKDCNLESKVSGSVRGYFCGNSIKYFCGKLGNKDSSDTAKNVIMIFWICNLEFGNQICGYLIEE